MTVRTLDALWKAERLQITAIERLPGRRRGVANAGTPHEQELTVPGVPLLFDHLKLGVPTEFSVVELVALLAEWGGEDGLGRLFLDRRLEIEAVRKSPGRRGRPRKTSLDPKEEDEARKAHELKQQGYTWKELNRYGHRETLKKRWKMLGLE